MTGMAERLQVHAFEPGSRANGPGVRAVLWLQGCTLGCPSCFNPETHGFGRARSHMVEELVACLLSLGERIEGVTISGGEPLQQPRPLLHLLRGLRRSSNLSVLLFSGYDWEEIRGNAARAAILPYVDVLLAGRYRAEQRLARGLRGSTSKTLHFLTNRYGPAVLAAVPDAEVLIGPDGTVRLSGIAPMEWPAVLTKLRQA
jgi:anaerobic ribonucleoside-triphosphate reductase activating protein